MPKIELWRLGVGEVFMFNEKSDLFALVEFDINFIDELCGCQKCIIKNIKTGKHSSANIYIPVYTEPFEFNKQLILF